MQSLHHIAASLHGTQKVTEASWSRTYRALCLAGRTWSRLGLGDTYAMTLIHHHNETLKPGSKEWRPNLIVKAIRGTA